ncbi:ATPase family AAA domain-containing protein 2-like isoform X2 [Neopelma chrysocephalum]|uniref:ATPase family AAA domain-containing protein 2-like isoform X2 n=1 Tax=Neopelma chrysocephalum TaxID=114329 RepID=UPI000FCD0C1C|nr:ATPase family AAA domain-containing protein 2-like isoform X2 [Neopelma chrysocephalum]
MMFKGPFQPKSFHDSVIMKCWAAGALHSRVPPGLDVVEPGTLVRGCCQATSRNVCKHSIAVGNTVSLPVILPAWESLNMGRTNTEKADNPGVSSGHEAKEGDGQRRSIRQRKAVERYQAPLENLGKHKMNFSNCTSPVRERDSCKRTKRSLSVNSRKDNLNEVYRTSHENQMEIGTSLTGVRRMQIGSSVQFDGVGGHSMHISALKEMIILPLLYPDLFEILKLKPPRGCLFYGPPGTGKTLVARALANECSRGDRKVTFFMRNAADCMSKWVGESERQLRLVFEQAYQMQPSIIFFDEIDALAPTRSSKQDQVHSSVVGTLLTLMDGLASRGEVMVIGATNRLDSIDPALRRPGRFEREFHFSLPNKKQARQEIFKIHTRDWTLKPSDNLLEELAEKCVGYCGADIKALCVEAGLCALRRRYPQIHDSDKRLKIDATSIKVTAEDFAMAMQKIVPASQRAGASPGQGLPPISKPLLENTLERILQALRRAFPHAELVLKKDQGNDVIDNEESPSVSGKMPTRKISDSKKAAFHTFSSNPLYQPTSFRPRFLLVEEPGSGQAFDLAHAVMHALEEFPSYTLDLLTLFVSSTSQEETCSQLIREAQRTTPSIIYIPQIPLWWEAVGPTLKAGFTGLLNTIPHFAPVLLLATSDVQHEDLPEEIKALFNNNREEVFKIPRPTCAERRGFFEDLIMKQAAEPPTSKNNADSRVHRVTHARSSQVDEQPQQVLDAIVEATESVSISSMAKLYSVLSLCIYQHRDDADKTELVTEMKKEIVALSWL